MDNLTNLYMNKVRDLTHEALVFNATALDLKDEVNRLKVENEALKKELKTKREEVESEIKEEKGE